MSEPQCKRSKHGGSLHSLSTEEPETELLGHADQIARLNQFSARPCLFKKMWRIIMDTLLAWGTHIPGHSAHHQISHSSLSCAYFIVWDEFTQTAPEQAQPQLSGLLEAAICPMSCRSRVRSFSRTTQGSPSPEQSPENPLTHRQGLSWSAILAPPGHQVRTQPLLSRACLHGW